MASSLRIWGADDVFFADILADALARMREVEKRLFRVFCPPRSSLAW